MPQHLIQYTLDDGSVIHVESNAPADETTRISRGRAEVMAGERFETALQSSEKALSAVSEMVKRIGPDETSVEVGFKFGAKAGVILASADSEATFKVTLKWKANGG